VKPHQLLDYEPGTQAPLFHDGFGNRDGDHEGGTWEGFFDSVRSRQRSE